MKVSILATECIQIHFLEEIHLEAIILPFTLIYGYGGYSTNIYIPCKTYLTSEVDTSVRHKFFIGFNTIYQDMACYAI